jgi:hypothetical protein
MIAEFSDATKPVITGIFSSPQPTECVPFQDEVFADGPRYKAWWDNLLPGTITGDLPIPTGKG